MNQTLRTPAQGLFWPGLLGFLWVVFLLGRAGPVGKTLFWYGGLYGLAFLLLGLLLWTFPARWSKRRQFIFIFLMAAVCRSLFLPFPSSYDVNRYIWEAQVFNKGLNPYLHAPNDPLLRPWVNEIWQHINHKDASGCYPPLAMLIFSLCARLSPTPLFFKIVMVLFDLGSVLILLGWTQSRGLPPGRALIYALNPLVLVFIAGEAHMDAIQVSFVSLAFFLFSRRRQGAAFVSLGCAVMSKYLAFIVLPFVIHRSNWKKSFGVFIPFLSYLPFRGSGTHLFDSLVPFGTAMHYNDSLTIVSRALSGGNGLLLGMAALGVCLVWIFLLVHDPLKSSFLGIGCVLVFLPTLHPWYLTLITPFLVFFPSPAWLYLHLAVAFTFPVLHREYQSGVFQEIHWLKLPEYFPFYALLFWRIFRPRPHGARAFARPVRKLSVIIPTLNESEMIPGALKCLKRETSVLETLVVDAGSSDGTRKLVSELGGKLIEGIRGRGLQVNQGIQEAAGDVILVLHADCRVRPGALDRVLRELNEHPHHIGGAMGMRYRIASIRNRFLALVNNFRARWTGISFGDQGQFFRKDALPLMHGYPNQMLMEDIELSLRMRECGSVCFVPEGMVVSGRRWQRRGFWKNATEVVLLSICYLIGRRLGWVDPKGGRFYERYYKEA